MVLRGVCAGGALTVPTHMEALFAILVTTLPAKLNPFVVQLEPSVLVCILLPPAT